MKRTISVLAVAASAVALGVSQAPASASPAPIHYQAYGIGQTVVLTTDAGDLVVDDGQLQIRDASRHVVSSIPLQYTRDGKVFPIAAQAADRTVVLIPSTDAAQAIPAAGDLNADAGGYISKQQRDDAALGRLGTEVGVPIAIGSLVGTAIGAGVGCLVGPAGCLVGLVFGAGVGGVAGTVLVGIPALAIAFANYNATVNAPFIKTQHI